MTRTAVAQPLRQRRRKVTTTRERSETTGVLCDRARKRVSKVSCACSFDHLIHALLEVKTSVVDEGHDAEERDASGLDQAVRLLRARRERPRGHRPAEQRYECAASDHSITSSARASSV